MWNKENRASMSEEAVEIFEEAFHQKRSEESAGLESVPVETNNAETRRKVLISLFANPALVLDLADALKEWHEEGHEKKGGRVNQVLRRANDGKDPGFNQVQISCLYDVWHSDAYEPLHPVVKVSSMVPALYFWRELLALRPDEVSGFHQAITTWGVHRDEESWKEVRGYFDLMDVGRKLTEEHAKALVFLTMDDTRLRSLRWFGADGDLW